MNILNMESLRKWLYKPRKGDTSMLALFYYADEELNFVASELDSFDGRKDPERCTALVGQLRRCQDKVLGICHKIMDDAIPGQRISRDFRAKFPDDVLTDTLAGELWFGAECLAAGSTIVNREIESVTLRPLAKAVTRSLENVRCLLRLQCMKLPANSYSDRTKEALKIFDKLFADFELSYVSVLVPVKSIKEFHMQQDVTVLFSETLQRALKMRLITEDLVDDCDPVLMFTIPRLAIVCGLLYYPEGALNIDVHSTEMSELFRPFQSLLHKIRDLLRTLSKQELFILERTLYSIEEPSKETNTHHDINALFPVQDSVEYIDKFYKNNNNCKQFITDFYSYNFGTSPNAAGNTQHGCDSPASSSLNLSPPRNGHTQVTGCADADSGTTDDDDDEHSSHKICADICMFTTGMSSANDNCDSNLNDSSSTGSSSSSCTSESSLDSSGRPADRRCADVNCCADSQSLQQSLSEESASDLSYTAAKRRFSEPMTPNRIWQRRERDALRTRAYGLPLEIPQLQRVRFGTVETSTPHLSVKGSYDTSETNDLGLNCCESELASSCCTSSVNSECHDDEEIALAIQAAEIASHHEIRSRFTDSYDLIHRLFVCISGVADQLQTNYASDLRNILKCVFDVNSSDPQNSVAETFESTLVESVSNSGSSGPHSTTDDDLQQSDEVVSEGSSVENGEDALVEMEKTTNEVDNELNRTSNQRAPVWIPDGDSNICMSCVVTFTILRRRHHCRNCGKIFCSKCSSNWMPLPHYGHNSPVRVCTTCFLSCLEEITQSESS